MLPFEDLIARIYLDFNVKCKQLLDRVSAHLLPGMVIFALWFGWRNFELIAKMKCLRISSRDFAFVVFAVGIGCFTPISGIADDCSYTVLRISLRGYCYAMSERSCRSPSGGFCTPTSTFKFVVPKPWVLPLWIPKPCSPMLELPYQFRDSYESFSGAIWD